MKCTTCGHEIATVACSISIPELNIEITPLQEWTKPYNKIVIPKGWRLAHDWELLWITRHDAYNKQLFPKMGDEYYYVWCASFKKGYASRLYLNRSLNASSDWDNLAVSIEGGRVAFVRDVAQKSKGKKKGYKIAEARLVVDERT